MEKPESRTSFEPQICRGWEDYELVDSGNGMKLERFGKYILSRPEAEAIWNQGLPGHAWQKADATFVPSSEEMGGHWVRNTQIPARWMIGRAGLRCWVQLSASRHIGLFPDQSSQWDVIRKTCSVSQRPLSMINLFGYTGMATLSAAGAGAKVTHIDASPKAVAWAKANQTLSSLEEKPIRWIVDDAVKFVQREVRRGGRYDILLLDPPKFGRGPRGEVWEFYRLLPDLLHLCQGVLSDDPVMVILTAYAVKASSITLANALSEMMSGYQGQTRSGELLLQESHAKRCLSTAVYAEWITSSAEVSK